MAKSLVSIDPAGCAIDMPAGPSEVLIIADENANSKFVAADLLSQAEHGPDSQVILLSDCDEVLTKVESEVKKQLQLLPRKEIISASLKFSLLIKCEAIDEMIRFSNEYAPEHLIIHLDEAKKYLKEISNAGSIFLGGYSPESAGDYSSGTNHSLPTYGYANAFSGVNLLSFMKSITYQELTKDGLKLIASSVIEMAKAEKLEAHANAVRIRLNE
jgi:histidinol dehydrogenase